MKTVSRWMMILVVAVACASPAERAGHDAALLGWTRESFATKAFELVVYRNRAAQPGGIPSVPRDRAAEPGPIPSIPRDGVLHIYLQGDASPRGAMRHRPPDPTPKSSPVFDLMRLDLAPSVLVARPGTHGAPVCEPIHWTTGRYGEPVVESLVEVIERLRVEERAGELVLIGHSGGGALAMLLAERLPQTAAVVTLAGNLDVGAWADHHGYTPLVHSLDPGRRPPLDAAIVQIHLLGGRDSVISPEWVRSAIARQPGAASHLYPSLDHRSGWAEIWPGVLEELDLALKSRSGRRP